MAEDIRVYVVPLKGKVRGAAVYMDGFFTILINEALSPEARMRTYKHEMEHIQGGDFEAIRDKRLTAGEAEEMRHHVVREEG